MTAPVPPPDPMTLIGEGMAQLHELYVSAIAAGFAKDEALTLVVRLALGKASGTENDQ